MKCTCKNPRLVFKEYKFLRQKDIKDKYHSKALKATCAHCGKLVGWYPSLKGG